MRLRSRLPMLMFVAMIVATWPVWRWYALRMSDGSDEPWGILALLTFVAGTRATRPSWPSDETRFVYPAVFLGLYVIAFPVVPPLMRALLATGAFGALLLRSPGAAGLWGLLGLSLPIMATLQFYLGFPLRLLAAEASALTLRCMGYNVVRDGSLLHWAGESVMVDAPCSGVQMLWFGFYLTFSLAAFYRFNVARTLVCAGATFVLIIAANMVRATMLFFKEAHIVSLPEWTHAGAGLLIFAGSVLLIGWLIRQLQVKPCAA